MGEILESPSSSGLLQDQRKRRHTTLAFIVGQTFIFGVAASLNGPLYPAEATKKGVTASAYGAVIGFSNLFIFLYIPLIGISLIQGRIGIWKFGIRDCLLGAFFIDGLALVLFGFLDFVNLPSVFTFLSFILRGLDGIGSAGIIALPVTLCLAFPDQNAVVVGLLETGFNSGIVIGPLLGEALFQLGGFICPFVVVGLVELILTLLACFVFPSIPNPPESQESMYQVLQNFLKLFRVPSFSLFVFLIILTGTGWGFLMGTLESHLEQFRLSPVETGLMFSMAGIPILATPCWGFLVDWTDRGKLVTFIGSLSAAVGALLIGPVSFLPLSPSITSTAFSLFLVGLGQGALLGSNFYNLVIGTRKLNGSSNNIADVIGVSCFYMLGTNLGGFLGPTVGGILLQNLGFRRASIFQLSVFVLICIAVATFSLVLAKGGMREREVVEEYKPDRSDEVTPLMKDSKS